MAFAIGGGFGLKTGFSFKHIVPLGIIIIITMIIKIVGNKIHQILGFIDKG